MTSKICLHSSVKENNTAESTFPCFKGKMKYPPNLVFCLNSMSSHHQSSYHNHLPHPSACLWLLTWKIRGIQQSKLVSDFIDHLQNVLSLKITTWCLWTTDYRPGVGLNCFLYFILDGSVPRYTHHDSLTGLLEYISKYFLSVLCNCMLLNLPVYHLWSGVGDKSNNSIRGSVTIQLEHWTCNSEALSLTLTVCWICSQ